MDIQEQEMFWLGVLVGVFVGVALVICGTLKVIADAGK